MNLEIFILCHNRPELAREAIQSVLQQDSPAYRLIISDNSSNDDVQKMVKTNFPSLEFRRRSSNLPALSHFNTCIGEAKANYFCLFHDDDIMFDSFVAEVHKSLASHPEATSIGTNACIKNSKETRKNISFLCFGSFEKIASAPDLFRRYFGRYHTGIAPFPGYIYKTSAIGDARIPVEGGKYADVRWLLTVASMGEMIWIAKPLFEYRIHGGNDSLQESPSDRLRLLTFLKKNRRLCGNDGLSDYRYFLYKKLVISLSGDNFSNRLKTINKFMNKHRISRLLRGRDYFFMIKRAILKRFTIQGDCL